MEFKKMFLTGYYKGIDDTIWHFSNSEYYARYTRKYLIILVNMTDDNDNDYLVEVKLIIPKLPKISLLNLSNN